MRNRIVQILLTVGLLALLVQALLIAPSQIRDSETKAAMIPAPEIETGDRVDQSMKGMHMVETQEGKKEWELWSKSALSIQAKELMELDTLKAIFFSDRGGTFTVTGKKGTVQVRSKDLSVEGNVIVQSDNGYTFRTHQIEYFSWSRLLTGQSAVEMIGPKDSDGNFLRLKGVGMSASIHEGSMEVLRDVQAEKTLGDGRRAIIKSQRSLFSSKDRTAKFFGEVVLDLDSMRITGPEAEFLYDKKTSAVRSVVFRGGARVSDNDKWATSEKVQIDFDTNRFTFRGQPRLVQNNDELRGEEIVFLDGGKRVQVKRARARVDKKRLEKQR